MGDDFEEKQGEIKQDKQFINMAKKELKKDEKDLKKMKEKGNKKLIAIRQPTSSFYFFYFFMIILSKVL